MTGYQQIQEVDIFIIKITEIMQGAKSMELICYGNSKEKIRLDFLPYKNTGDNKQWDKWHPDDYLRIYASDYVKLLPYIEKIFPLVDPVNGEIQDYFDECYDNWISVNDWREIVASIKKDITNIENGVEILFFNKFISWIEKQMTWADIIVVEGNL